MKIVFIDILCCYVFGQDRTKETVCSLSQRPSIAYPRMIDDSIDHWRSRLCPLTLHTLPISQICMGFLAVACYSFPYNCPYQYLDYLVVC